MDLREGLLLGDFSFFGFVKKKKENWCQDYLANNNLISSVIVASPS
jgi:hypothetical protein